MKKVYLLASALMVGGLATGQRTQYSGVISPFMQEADKAKTETHFGDENANMQHRGGSVIWSEDFANGLAGNNTSAVQTWTVGGTHGNIWKHDMFGPEGCYSQNTPNPLFTTAANGHMLFDVDSSNCINASTNPPTITEIDREGELISPSIDLTGEMNVNVRFEHQFRYCCTATLELMLGVSNDGGANWTEWDVSAGVDVNDASANPQIANINVTQVAANQPNVMIRFRWGGGISHYFWSIDDVAVIPSPAHEADVVDAFWGGVQDGIPYTMVPDEEAQDFYSYGNMSNQGATTEDLSFDIDISGAATLMSGTGSNSPITLAPGQGGADGLGYDSTNTAWNSGTTIGAYTQTYTVDYPNIGMDDNTTNNEITYPFWVTDHRYGRDDDTYRGTGIWNSDDGAGTTNSFTLGPLITMTNSATVYSIEVAFTGSTDAGVLAYPEIYEVDATGNFSLVYTGSGTSDEVTLTNADISVSPTVTPVKLQINGGTGSGGFTLNGNTQYLFCVGHYGGPNALVIMNGGITAPEQTVFLYDPNAATGGPWFYTTSTPMIRAVFDPEGVGIDEEENGINLGQNMPNPFDGSSRINFSLENSANVTFEITDVTGKIVKTIQKGNLSAGNHMIELDANEFAGGIYNYTIKADGATSTKRMIITK